MTFEEDLMRQSGALTYAQWRAKHRRYDYKRAMEWALMAALIGVALLCAVIVWVG